MAANITWSVQPGLATDIGAGPNGEIWVTGTNPVAGGFGVFYWNGSVFQAYAGGAVRIAVGLNNTPWVVNNAGNIFQANGAGGWKQLPGLATDIGVGPNGEVWVIGTNPVAGGFGVFYWNGSAFQPYAGGGVRIAVGPNNTPWVINNAGNIFQANGAGGWKQLPGLATDIGVEANGHVCVIGTNPVAGGLGIFVWNGADWLPFEGGATNISVRPSGPVVVNSAHSIFFGSLPSAQPPAPNPHGPDPVIGSGRWPGIDQI